MLGLYVRHASKHTAMLICFLKPVLKSRYYHPGGNWDTEVKPHAQSHTAVILASCDLKPGWLLICALSHYSLLIGTWVSGWVSGGWFKVKVRLRVLLKISAASVWVADGWAVGCGSFLLMGLTFFGPFRNREGKTWFPSSRNSQPKLRYELVSLKIYIILQSPCK